MTNQVLLSLLFILCAAAASYAVWRFAKHQDQREAEMLTAAHAAERARDQSVWSGEQIRLTGEIARLEGELAAESRAHREARSERDTQRKHNGELELKMEPLRAALTELTNRMGDSDRARVRAQTELQEQVTTMARQFGEASADVKSEARRLTQVLSRNEKRGAWGEMQLRQLVESSGMLNRVHFVEQDHTTSDDKVLRPDMVISLAGGRKAVVDSKVPLDAFLRMDTQGDPKAALAAHASAVLTHIQKLSGKEYWRRYDSLEFVILFLPAEGLLSAAMESRPDLLQQALDRKIILATPTTLLAILHAINQSWRQADAAEQAQEIQTLGAEFLRRIVKMADTINALGVSLGKTVKAYDATVATIESRVLPQARKMEALSIGSGHVPEVEPLDITTRALHESKWVDETEIIDPQATVSISDPKLRSA